MNWCCCHYQKLIKVIISPAHGLSVCNSSSGTGSTGSGGGG